MIFLREADSSGMALQLSSPQRPSAGTDSHRRADIRVTLGRESIPLLIAYRDAAAAKAPDEKEKAALPAGPFKVPDTANVA